MAIIDENNEVNTYLRPAFEDIRNYLPELITTGHRLAVARPQDYDGWVDGFGSRHYLAVFDKRYDKGRGLAKFVRERKNGFCDFNPFPDFKVSGKLLVHKSTDGLEWIVISLE